MESKPLITLVIGKDKFNIVSTEPVTSHINLYITYGRRVGLGLDKEYSILYVLVTGSVDTA